MPCFCTVPVSALSNSFDPKISMALPSVPISLILAAAIPGLNPEERLDMRIAAELTNMSLPNIDFGGGPMAQIAMSLSMMMGTFALDDLPLLEFQMEQAAASFNSHVWPQLKGLASISMQPLLNYALAARLVINLQDLGIDPFSFEMFSPSLPSHTFQFALRRPQLRMARLLAGLPPLFNLSAALDIPPLGDPGAVQALQNRLDGYAMLTPPRLIVPMPMLTKLAMVLESLATIEAAFGDDAFAPSTLGPVRMMLQKWGGFPIPFPPMPALALDAKLAALPPLEDIRLGEQLAGSYSSATFMNGFTPPKLAIGPFMNVMLGLSTAMTMTLKLDLPPFDMCGMCPCA